YLSPEQAQDARDADIRSDLYSLGCTFYYLLTGRPPFAGGTILEKLARHQLGAPPPLEGLRPDVPAEVVAVVRKLMARRPEDRYQTPAEVLAALAALPAAEAGPLVAPPTPPGGANRPDARGIAVAWRRWLLPGVLAAVLAAGLGAVAWKWATRGSGGPGKGSPAGAEHPGKAH